MVLRNGHVLASPRKSQGQDEIARSAFEGRVGVAPGDRSWLAWSLLGLCGGSGANGDIPETHDVIQECSRSLGIPD